MSGALTERLAGLSGGDRRLLLAMAGTSIGLLLLGTAGGVLMALARGGFIGLEPETGYRLLTLHGVSIFFYWLYLAQGVILLALAAAEGGQGLSSGSVARLGFGLMVVGAILSIWAGTAGDPLLYNGSPDLGGEQLGVFATFNSGYLLLGLGLLAVPFAALRTLLASVRRGAGLSSVGFALFLWAGFLMVSGVAALYVFVPGLFWGLGLGPVPADHSTNWHILFHNLHYLPLMATVIVWYALMREIFGVSSIFGARFSKLVFATYLVFVPPTSLYHMFLEPNLPPVIRIAGSLLSLFVSVPTLTALLIIVATLEVHARARGARGLFGWIAQLPWHEPAVAATGFAVVNLAFGLVLAFVLIQADLAPLLSDTFFVPAYFHFFTVGTVSLSFLAMLSVLMPALTGQPIAGRRVVRWMPQLATAGLAAFGGAGVAAGYLGLPRRVVDASYDGEAPALWSALLTVVAAGGTVMALSMTVLALSVAASLIPARRNWPQPERRNWGTTVPRPGAAALLGPIAILVIVAGMYGATAVSFELMRALPVEVAGGGGGH